MTDDPYAHLPLMQRPGYIQKDTKWVRAKLVQVGDEIRQSEKIKGGLWKVARIEATEAMVWVWYEGRPDHKLGLGLPNERVWVDRVAPGAVPVPFPEDAV